MPDLARVRLLTDTNITLAGLQTIQGLVLASGDRVAVAGQTDPVLNGIYIAASTAWTRATDFAAGAVLGPGLDFHVDEPGPPLGHGGETWYLFAETTVTVGTSTITFYKRTHRRALEADGEHVTIDGNAITRPAKILPQTVAYPASLTVDETGDVTAVTGGAPLAVALQKANVRVVAIANQALTGTPVINGIQTAAGDEVLLTGQTAPHENGVWVVAAGSWARRADLDTSAEVVPGIWMRAMEGTRRGRWFLATTGTITLGTTALAFEKEGTAGDGLAQDGDTLSLEETGITGGTYTNPTITLDEFGRAVGVGSGTTPSTFIEGLAFVRVSDTAVTLRAGSAWVPGLDAVLEAPTDIAKTGLVLAANTIYYGYLWSNAGTPDLELSTTAPAAAYRGIAKTKTGDTTRRYVGEFLTDAAGAITTFAVRTWEQATETERGAAFLATQALVTGGTNDRAQLTPLKLKNEFDRRGLFTDAYCEITHSGNQAFSDQIFTSIVWDAEVRDPRNWRVPAQPARVTPDQPGMYLATLYTAWPSPTSGVKRQRIRVSDITTLAFDGTDSTLSLNIQTTTALVYIGAGDYITADVWQNSGGNLNLGSARLTVARVV